MNGVNSQSADAFAGAAADTAIARRLANTTLRNIITSLLLRALIRARSSGRIFIARTPELIKRYWKATIRGYHFMRIVPENFPFQRMVESKIRVNNPDPSENMRDLRPIRIMESAFFPLDGQLTVEGVWRILEEHQEAGVLAKSITRKDVEEVVSQELVKEAWEEISQTDEVKQNLERLQPVVEKYGY
jgi:hypothetical protein